MVQTKLRNVGSDVPDFDNAITVKPVKIVAKRFGFNGSCVIVENDCLLEFCRWYDGQMGENVKCLVG